MDTLDKAEETGENIDLDFECIGRNGLYEEEQLYAVYEKKDLEGFINFLINNCVGA